MSLKLPQENIYGHRKKLKFILNAIESYSKKRMIPLNRLKVLDFGCGNGTAVSYQIADLGVQLTGVDFHLESIEYAKKNNRFPNARFIYGDENTVLEIKESFHIIVYSDIIEHLPNPKSTILKLRRVHKDDGIIVGAIPNGYGPFELEKRVASLPIFGRIMDKIFYIAYRIRLKIINEPWQPPSSSLPYNVNCGHVQFFTLKGFFHFIHDNGYKVLQFQNGSFLGAPSSEPFFGFNKFINWNVSIANKLPSQFVSTWYFVCEKKGDMKKDVQKYGDLQPAKAIYE